jgi:hypothetical protein
MTNRTERQFEETNAAVTKAVTDFVNEIGRIIVEWDAVAPTHIIETTLMELCSRASNLTDELETVVGPATQKLLAALAEYRDSKLEDR